MGALLLVTPNGHSMLQRSLILTTAAFLLAVGAHAQEIVPGGETAYAVQSGDRIQLQMFTAAGVEVGEVEGERIIDRAGNVFLPYVGTVMVVGLDQGGIRELLVDRYSEFYSDPVIDVKVELKISVTGAVPQPGQFYLDPTATLAEALATAGGTTPEFAISAVFIPSDPTQVRLVRDGVATILNFRAEEVSQETLNMRIKSGDWLHVPYQPRSRVRDEIQFWGSVIGILTSTIGLAVLIGR